jgi:phosphopantothenoylcysteine decarboxylase / phosphopantothenate---cysteine ligase
MARVLVGITGGIAAYKACELVRLFVRSGNEVLPLVTPGAERFVRAETFRALAGHRPEGLYPHLERADLYVIAPLTANTLAKLAHGLADNVVSEAALAHDGPLLVAPAMNVRMWNHPATQANLQALQTRGVHVVGPAQGELAEGGEGIGRMAEPVDIFERAAKLLEASSTSLLQGKTVVVTAGGTREPIDAVRFVGNRSSGRMGTALAAEARRRGARVTLIASNLGVDPPADVEVVQAPTAADLAEETLSRSEADVLVMAAAVADYRPARAQDEKRPKDDRPWPLELEPTDDILRTLGDQTSNARILVGFAAETGADGLARARAKRTGKNADLVVYNDVARSDVGFDSADNEVVLISEAGERKVEKAPKRQIAVEVWDEIERLIGENGGRATG